MTFEEFLIKKAKDLNGVVLTPVQVQQTLANTSASFLKELKEEWRSTLT